MYHSGYADDDPPYKGKAANRKNALTVEHYAGTVAKFIVPDWGDKVDYGIGLSYPPTSLVSLTGRYDNPMPLSTLSPQSGTMNLETLTVIVQHKSNPAEQLGTARMAIVYSHGNFQEHTCLIVLTFGKSSVLLRVMHMC